MILLIDSGNSRLKWAIFQEGKLQTSYALNNQTLNADKLIDAWKDLPIPKQLAIANVSSTHLLDIVKTVATELWPYVPFIQVKSESQAFGVKNAYLQPEKLGVDRWLALIAAHNFYQKPACIIDCGTAITIDFIDADGNHQGGMISPGLTLMKQSLATSTDLLAFNEASYNIGPANFTEAAIYNGTLSAATGLIEHVLSKQEPLLTVILTGGDASVIAEQLTIKVIIDLNLVLHGLAVVASKPSIWV